jgi:glycosyltransferase involved in cell wall biosynthesis
VKIALIAPSPVPFQVGGAEKLFWGLQRYLNAETSHACELIKLPSPEGNFWQLVASYEAFTKLDVTHFDLVISGKYPSWMVPHDNHAVYMLHRLRGLYDAYHLFGLPLEPVSQNRRVHEFLQWLNDVEREPTPHANAVTESFDRLRELRAHECDAGLFEFPGPFGRRVIHFLDNLALAPARIRRFAAISHTVSARAGYFPQGADIHVLHPPSGIEGLTSGADDYFFTVSRLDGAKRVALVIDAMKYVTSDIPLLIAGSGPDEAELKVRAGDDRRIRFLGFLSDEQVAAYYRDALAVPYVPYDEDYGLITVEAMMCSKPVVTVRDAGGPNELVRDGISGYIVPPNAKAIGERLEYLCDHRAEARAMGSKGHQRAASITWESVATGLIGGRRSAAVGSRGTKPKLTVATTFPIFPPRGGGQSRVYHLYRYLAPSWTVEIVSFAGAGAAAFYGEIAPGLREIRVPKSNAHEREEQRLSEACNGIPVTDIAMPRLHALSPDYLDALRRSMRTSGIVVACHPYLIDAIASNAGAQSIWYEAQDVEVDLKKQVLPSTAVASELLDDVARVEARCWKESALVYACSRADLDRLREHYGETTAALLTVPNGVSADDVGYTDAANRREIKRRLGLCDSRIALFMGSWHPPNLEAVEHVIALARARKDIYFLVLGSVGMAFTERAIPSNVGLAGSVDDDTKNVILSLADIAINPMGNGSGTNLKMLEYFAAGLPVVSTPFGARGLDVHDDEHLRITALTDFPAAIDAVLNMEPAARSAMTGTARKLVESHYQWNAIAHCFRRNVMSLQRVRGTESDIYRLADHRVASVDGR